MFRISFADARKGSAVLDVTDEEAEELARKAGAFRKIAVAGLLTSVICASPALQATPAQRLGRR